MGKKAEKEAAAEKAAAKKAEKEARKAAAAARKNARKDAKKGAAAEDDEFEESNVANWTDEEQANLNEGLAEFPPTMDKKERWRAIADKVGSRSMKECAARFKEVPILRLC